MSDIVFYSQHLAEFEFEAITSEATGFEKEFMLDRRLATYWKASSGATQDIDIDMTNADNTVDYVVLFGDFDVDDTIIIYYDDNSGFSSPTAASGTVVITVAGWRFVKIGFLSQITTGDRYFRVRIDPDAAAPSVATLFIGAENEITVRYNKNQIEAEYDYSDIKLVTAYGGERGATEQAPPRRYWRFTYEVLDITNKGKLDTIISESVGKKYPIVFQDTASVFYYVRILNDRLDARQVEHQLFNTTEILLEEELGAV